MSLIPFTTYKLCVVCMTYNHAPYIEDALKGFAIQKTNFPFMILVCDDASTDGEQEVINHYIDDNLDKSSIQIEETDDAIIIAGIHKDNPNCHFVFEFLKYNFYSVKKAKTLMVKDWYKDTPYRAICEGDDYWTNPLKLQKQVDFLETHPKCGLIYTDFDIYVQRSNKLEKDMIKSGRYAEIKSFEEHLLKAGYLAPPSWLYRTDKNVFLEDKKNPRFVDYSFSLALEFFKHSEVYFMNNTTCVYRILQESASHKKSWKDDYLYHKKLHNQQRYFAKKYSVSNDLIKEIDTIFYRKYYKTILAIQDEEEILEMKPFLKQFGKQGLLASYMMNWPHFSQYFYTTEKNIRGFVRNYLLS